jgi:hypothetical protein
MKALLATAFFLVSTIVLGVFCYMAAAGKGSLPLLVAFLAYLAIFVRFGCMAH